MIEAVVVEAPCGIIKDILTRSTLHVGEGEGISFFH